MREQKTYAANLKLTEKQLTLDGVNYGTVSGYAVTWDTDMSGDRFDARSLSRSLNEYRSKGRAIRMLYQHDRKDVIGAFPITDVVEDNTGVFVQGMINLDTNRGRDIYALLRQKALSDFSVGVWVNRARLEQNEFDFTRVIEDADIIEVSIVDMPANPNSVIVEVKSYDDITVAPIGTPWDAEGASARIKECDCNHDLAQYMDAVDGAPLLVPRAAFAAAAKALLTGQDQERGKIESCYKRMNMVSPFEKGLGLNELRAAALYDIELKLKSSGFNAKATSFLIEAYVAKCKLESASPSNDAKKTNAGKIDSAVFHTLVQQLKDSIHGKRN